MSWISRNTQEIVDLLRTELESGGCAAVVCNTVGRAQEVYRAIKQAAILADENLILFHARFPFVWRDEIEQKVLSHFGKEGPRPSRSVVIATQVIEQSLDLDFDMMISDLAPIDLLLQRAGRLHRHARTRPEHLIIPRLWIATPDWKDGLPDFGNDSRIYEPYILLASYLSLQGRQWIEIPEDTTELIESVYMQDARFPEAEKILQEALKEARQAMFEDQREEIFQARQRLVLSPQDEDLLDQAILGLEEEDPSVHKALQALTRLFRPSVSLICLHLTTQGLALDPDDNRFQIDLDVQPNHDEIGQLLHHSVSVQHWRVVENFLSQEPYKPWKKLAALRYHHPIIFEDGVCHLNGTPYTLRISRDYGLEIVKEVT